MKNVLSIIYDVTDIILVYGLRGYAANINKWHHVMSKYLSKPDPVRLVVPDILSIKCHEVQNC